MIRESGFDIGLHRDPYVGSVPLVSGEIGEDFAYYLAKSEQIPSAVLLGVLLQNAEPFVRAAGGVLVQMMPGANPHLITMIEDTIAHAPHLTSVINDGATPRDLAKLALRRDRFRGARGEGCRVSMQLFDRTGEDAYRVAWEGGSRIDAG